MDLNLKTPRGGKMIETWGYVLTRKCHCITVHPTKTSFIVLIGATDPISHAVFIPRAENEDNLAIFSFSYSLERENKF